MARSTNSSPATNSTRTRARVRVDEVTDTGRVVTVYNFRITEHHTYFVGGDEWGFSVWTHNAEYAVLPHASGNGFALAEKQADRSIIFVAERNSANVRPFTTKADAVAAINSGGGTRVLPPTSTLICRLSSITPRCQARGTNSVCLSWKGPCTKSPATPIGL